MVRLSVNLNKVALIRNSRGDNYPDLIHVAQDCELFGAQGITVHPRPDERHARYDDLQPLKDTVTTEFNIEGYPSERFLAKVCAVRPHQCTLVPDPPDALTSNTGWDTRSHQSFLQETVIRLQEHGIRVSLFLNADERMVESAANTGTDRVELYTGGYAKLFQQDPEQAVKNHTETAKWAHQAGLGLNAGHDLNLDNLGYYVEHVDHLLEVSIGHALICDALYVGYQSAIRQYLELLQPVDNLPQP